MSNNKKAIHLIDLIQLKLGVFLKLDDEFSSLSAQKRPHDSYQGEGYLRLVEHLSEEVLIRGDTYNRKLHDRVAPIALKNLLEQHKWLADLKIDKAQFMKEQKINGMDFFAWLEQMALKQGEWYDVKSSPMPVRIKYPDSFVDNPVDHGPDICLN